MKKDNSVVLVSKSGEELRTSNPREIQFAQDMEKAGIEWHPYSGRGMYGRYCPSAHCRSDGTSEEAVIRATHISGLFRDSLGKGTVLYTG